MGSDGVREIVLAKGKGKMGAFLARRERKFSTDKDIKSTSLGEDGSATMWGQLDSEEGGSCGPARFLLLTKLVVRR